MADRDDEGSRFAGDRSQALRARLAAVGIVLDEPAAPKSTATSSPRTSTVVDREAVRAILVAAGAPKRDLEWLVVSAPSVQAAMAYSPPHEKK